jgi:hypothetical protein
MYLKCKMIFLDQDGQHSYVDLVKYLMVSRSGKIKKNIVQ